MKYPNTFRKMIENQILDHANEQGLELTREELRIATGGVEYCISEVMVDSINDALSNVKYDRERNKITVDNNQLKEYNIEKGGSKT
jgi:Mn-dependent DtxR family transcriptional regulator